MFKVDRKLITKINIKLIGLFRKPYINVLFRKWLYWTEGSEYYSQTLRYCFIKYYNIDIGLYSYGGCFNEGALDPNTVIGRYCSIASNIRIMNRNHPSDLFSTHPFFYNSKAGIIEKDVVDHSNKIIGNDVWMGNGAMVLPRVQKIGDGAIIGAGSVVTKDVPDFAVVAGNPAKIIRFRFSDKIIERVKSSRWWDEDIETVIKKREEYKKMLEE
jgi:virginiamycin A acetyltransferase